MQLRCQMHHALISMLPARCDPVVNQLAQLRDLGLLPLCARPRDRLPIQLRGFVVAQCLCQHVDENRLVLGRDVAGDHEAEGCVKLRQPT